MAKSREEENIIQFTFGLDDPELEDEERLKFSKKLLRELRNLDGNRSLPPPIKNEPTVCQPSSVC